MSRSLDDLCDKMKPIAKQFVKELTVRGIPHAVIETLRSPAVHIAYYAQGREPLDLINAKRRIAGLLPITEAEGKKIITHAIRSKHLDGKAMDVVPLTSRGSIWWTAPEAVWLKIGEVGEECGLEWGGRWGAKDGRLGWDCPHFEI